MKGVILAGGLGTRLRPLTSITNKHLLPVYNKPMVYYPIQMLVDAGIRDIMVVTGGNSAGDFLRLLGNGEEFGLSRINYAYQKGEGGIAEALGLARDFVDDDRMVVVLGDNILEKGIARGVEAFARQARGARIFLKSVEHPWEYGIAETAGSKIVRIIEKPRDPPGDLAVIGVYMYPPDVFQIVELEGDRVVRLVEKPAEPASDLALVGVYMFTPAIFDSAKAIEPSARGELEITDVNNAYIQRGELEYEIVDGWWMDAGEDHEALLRANIQVARQQGVDI
jgi:glucose-1-phosphate thymidylyltransferase